MPTITKLTKQTVYRDSKTYYLEAADAVSPSGGHIEFFCTHAHRKVLDLGCATGNYCLELTKHGFECQGADIDEAYVKRAREKGVTAHLVDNRLPFEDASFETVIMSDVLEHIEDPHTILAEVKRVAEKNILITVPNCGAMELLAQHGLVYEHLLELDHVQFFSKAELEDLLAKHFPTFRVEEREPILLGKAGLPWWLRKPVSLLYRLKILRPEIYYRLYAVVDVIEDQ